MRVSGRPIVTGVRRVHELQLGLAELLRRRADASEQQRGVEILLLHSPKRLAHAIERVVRDEQRRHEKWRPFVTSASARRERRVTRQATGGE
jgi:hypothetical protein